VLLCSCATTYQILHQRNWIDTFVAIWIDERANESAVPIPIEITPEGATPSRIDALASLVPLMAHRIYTLEHEVRRLEGALVAMSALEATSSHEATHDGLTGLPTRALLADRFRQAALRVDRHGGFVAVLFIDLDDFKNVNDKLGHAIGDIVLQCVAQRIQQTIRASDTACRYGGDEFAVVLADLADEEIAVELAEKIRNQIAMPYFMGTTSVSLVCSIGIAVYPRDGTIWEVVMAHADAAMYRAKRTLHLDFVPTHRGVARQ
jgi:diguanylate cyclase (GGDEF)-like protein